MISAPFRRWAHPPILRCVWKKFRWLSLKGFTITTTKFKRPTLDVMPVNAKASALYANNARMLREAYAKGYQNAIVTDALGNVAELAASMFSW